MEELIARIVANVGIDDSTAHKAVRIILSFLYQQGEREKVTALAAAIPGAAEYIDESEPDSAATLGGLGGLMGGGAMEVLSKLQAIGLGLSARAFGVYFISEQDQLFQKLRARLRLEHGLLLALAVALAGFTLVGIILGRTPQFS